MLKPGTTSVPFLLLASILCENYKTLTTVEVAKSIRLKQLVDFLFFFQGANFLQLAMAMPKVLPHDKSVDIF